MGEMLPPVAHIGLCLQDWEELEVKLYQINSCHNVHISRYMFFFNVIVIGLIRKFG